MDVIVARDIDWELKVYTENIRNLGSVVYMAIILGVAGGILASKDRIPLDVLGAWNVIKVWNYWELLRK